MRVWICAAILSAAFFVVTLCVPVPSLDVIIRGGYIVDGTGGSSYTADISIKDGFIFEIGDLSAESAKRVIDAAGRVVAPGFIDMMGGSSVPLLRDPVTAESKLRQGITTILVGEGSSAAPRDPAMEVDEYANLDVAWTTFAEYFPLLEKKGIAINVVHTVGAAQVRKIAIGDIDREPTPAQLDRMRELVAEAMEDGAIGLSTALIYPPGSFAKTEELIELAKVAAAYNGVYFTHMRNESNRVLEAIAEAIRISGEAGIPSHIFHLKAAGKENWHLMPTALDRIAKARSEGLEVTADVYPYIRNGIGLESFIHPRHYARGEDVFFPILDDPNVKKELRREIETSKDWENWYRHTGNDWDKVLITRVRDDAYQDVVGLSVKEAADKRGENVWDMFFDLVQAEAGVVPETMNEEQKHQAMRAPFMCFDNDASPTNPDSVDSVHPRAFGAFPRILAKYVREEKIIGIEDAVHKLAALPARILKLENRGIINPGMAADIAIFDPEKIRDRATFTEPLVYSEGIDYILVNGIVVIDDGRITGEMPGKVLRHKTQ